MIPMPLFRIREFAAGNLAALMLTASLFSTVFFLAQYLQIGLGYSPLGASVGMSVQGLGMLWIAYNAHQHYGYTASIAALVVAGVGTTMAMPAQQSAAMTSVPPQSMGKAAGTFSTLRQLGGAVGIAILAAVFAARGNDSSPVGFTDGFAAAMVPAAILAFAGAAAGMLAPGRQRAPRIDEVATRVPVTQPLTTSAR